MRAFVGRRRGVSRAVGERLRDKRGCAGVAMDPGNFLAGINLRFEVNARDRGGVAPPL